MHVPEPSQLDYATPGASDLRDQLRQDRRRRQDRVGLVCFLIAWAAWAAFAVATGDPSNVGSDSDDMGVLLFVCVVVAGTTSGAVLTVTAWVGMHLWDHRRARAQTTVASRNA